MSDLTLDNAGGAGIKLQISSQRLSATELTTGDIYHSTGADNTEFSGPIEFNGKTGAVATSTHSFNIIGQSTGVNLVVRETIHLTINSDGTVKSFSGSKELNAIDERFKIICM